MSRLEVKMKILIDKKNRIKVITLFLVGLKRSKVVEEQYKMINYKPHLDILH